MSRLRGWPDPTPPRPSYRGMLRALTAGAALMALALWLLDTAARIHPTSLTP